MAAYLLDRADQYATDDWRWNPLADAAHAFMSGEVQRLLDAGELRESDLRRRVKRFREIERRIAQKDARRERGQKP